MELVRTRTQERGVNDCFTARDGHQKVEGRERDLGPLGEKRLRKKGTWLGGRAEMQPRQRCKTDGVELRA